MPEQDSLIGQQLGAYQIQQKLGEGGMARVYKAYHARLRREVAIKVILAHIAAQDDFRARFEREAQLIASLEHPNIVAVYDFSDEGPLAYLTMQYVGGGTLREQLRGGQHLDPPRAAYYALQMARALHHAHQRGIVHRDVKPQNMLVSAHNRNQLLLSDFGIAKLFDTSQEGTWSNASIENAGGNSNGLTSTDQIIGTAEYMAPEQISRQAVDARTDVYALGVVLFQMLTGRVPFLSTTAMGLMYQHVHTPPPTVHELNPTVPEIFAQITARAMQKAPEARFSSAEAMAQALESALSATNSRSLFPSDAYAMPPGDQTAISALQNPAESYSRPQTALPPSFPSAYGQPPSALSTGAQLNNTPQFTTGTYISNANNTLPVHLPAHKPISRQITVGIGIAILLLALIVMRALQTTTQTSGPPTPTPAPAKAFVETFPASNPEDWLEGSSGGLTYSISHGHYTLIADGTKAMTYFPHPKKIGSLPTNFTLTEQITQDTGSPDTFYGLAFDLKYQGIQATSCYALAIRSDGNYQILRYSTTNQATTPTALWAAQSSAILGLKHTNTLQATVRNGTFSFKINGTLLTLKDGSTSITDTTDTGGQPGVIVTNNGSGASFTVSRVQLAIP